MKARFRRVFRPVALGCALLCALAAAMPFASTALLGQGLFFFEVVLSTSVPAGVQLYYDTGHGFNESESVYHPLFGHSVPKTYRFALPAGYFKALRFDPMDHPGKAVFSGAKIVDRYGAVIRRFPARQFRANEEIATTVRRGDRLEMVTKPDGNDPFYLIEFGRPFWLTAGIGQLARACRPPFLIVFAAVLLLASCPWPRFLEGAPARWARSRPNLAIAGLSALTIAIACHPVIFFGKSFVSPNNGVVLWHDHPPTLPGVADREEEWPQYSDVGAMMWWHLYCPVIAREALWKDHELPLWNRYTMCGLPFLGQGQSMFGDPLNWISILADGAAWSWDLRFIVARWLLCFGLGLVVHLLTRRLGPALAVAAGAGFLGFFVFRLNHAANFSLGYSPWILVAWIGVIRAVTWRQGARACLGLILANFCEMNSGTVKEAYILIACLNLAGLLLLAFEPIEGRRRIARAALAVGAGITLALASAPWWRTFLAALKHSWTSYDRMPPSQIPPDRLIGFFDDLFSRQLLADERTYLPAVNFFFLVGVAWAFVAWRDLIRRSGFFPLILAAIVPFAFAFGAVPASVISRIPFVANIVSIDNTFSCPLIILAAVLSGYGFTAFVDSRSVSAWWTEYVPYLLLIGGLCLLFFASHPGMSGSGFFVGYAWSLLLIVVLAPLLLRWAKRAGDPSAAAAIVLAGFFLLVWRGGQYLQTPFDDYVFNPKSRGDLRVRSAAVPFLDARLARSPARPLGIGLNLFAGYNEMLGWESILGVDPLRNRHYDELAAGLGLERVRNADQPTPEDTLAAHLAGLNLLNVGYYLAEPSARPLAAPGLRRIGRFDLDVYESEGAWPRAFFTDRLWRYRDAAQLVQGIRTLDGRPFAAAELRDETLPPGSGRISGDLASRTVLPATDYRLTANTTSFEVDAPTPGVVVLTENYYPHDFRVRVNGRKSAYFRVNHAFKGVYLDLPGHYLIEYEYWPRSLNFSLQLGAIGIAALLAYLFAAFLPAGPITPVEEARAGLRQRIRSFPDQRM